MAPTKEFTQGMTEAIIPILCPHELLAVLYDDHRAHFDKHILNGSASTIPEFWDEMVDRPCCPAHPMHRHKLSGSVIVRDPTRVELKFPLDSNSVFPTGFPLRCFVEPLHVAMMILTRGLRTG